jgi:hypothetical protein
MYRCSCAQGGHADFSPRDQTEFELMEFIKKNARSVWSFSSAVDSRFVFVSQRASRVG